MKILTILIFTIMIVKADESMIERINKTLEQIAYESNQKKSINLDIKYDPFYNVEKKKKIEKIIKKQKAKEIAKKVKKSLQLSMILNQKAFINGRWYKEREKVEQYVLTSVNSDSIVLKNKNNSIILKLKEAKNLLIKKRFDD